MLLSKAKTYFKVVRWKSWENKKWILNMETEIYKELDLQKYYQIDKMQIL